MFNSVCGEQQPHPARHEAGTEKTRAPNIWRPPGHGTPRRTTAGTTAASTQKGQRRARRRDLRQPQCRRPRVPWRQARRLHRQPTTPGRTGPWARRPKGPPPHNRGPARPVGPGPANRPPRGPALARASCPARNHQRTGGILHRQGMVVGWGSTKMMSAELKRPDLTHRRRRQAHITQAMFPPSCTQTIFTHFAPCRHTKMDTVPHTHTTHMHSILLGPGTTTPRGVVSADPGAEPPSLRRGDRRTTPVPAAAEKINSPDPTGRPVHPHSPRPQTETENRGVRKKKKKKKTPCFTSPSLK